MLRKIVILISLVSIICVLLPCLASKSIIGLLMPKDNPNYFSGFATNYPIKESPEYPIYDRSIDNRISGIALQKIIGNGKPFSSTYNPDKSLFLVSTISGLNVYSTKDWIMRQNLPLPGFQDMKYSPDGEYLALINSNMITVTKGDLFQQIYKIKINCPNCTPWNNWDISSDSKQLVVGVKDKLLLIRLNDGIIESEIPHPNEIGSVKYFPGGLAVGTSEFTIEIWDPASHVLTNVIKAVEQGSKTNKLISQYGLNLKGGGPSTTIGDIAFTSDTGLLAARVRQGKIYIIDPSNGIKTNIIDPGLADEGRMRFINNNTRLISAGNASNNGYLFVWSLKPYRFLYSQDYLHKYILLSNDGEQLFVYNENTIDVFKRDENEPIARLKNYATTVLSARVLNDGSILSGEANGAMEIFSETGELIRSFGENYNLNSNNFEFSSSGDMYATFDFGDQKFKVFNTFTGLPIFTLGDWSNDAPNNLLFSPNDTYVALFNNRVSLFNLKNKMKVLDLPDGECLTFSRDEKFIATCDKQQNIVIYDIESGTVQLKIVTHAKVLDKLAFSNDKYYIAARYNEDEIYIWKLADGRLLRELPTIYPGTDLPMTNLYFTSQDLFVIAGYQNGKFVVMCSDGYCKKEIDLPLNLIDFIQSPDGNKMVIAMDGGIIQYWDCPLGD